MDKQEILGVNHSTHDLNSHCDQRTWGGLHIDWLSFCAFYKSAGGVLLPKAAVKFERYLMGEILSVGADVGEVEAGKKVLFSDINAYEVDLGTDAKHCFCKSGDLLAVVE
uniref:Uncharacterized protein n=1 Tax=Quercus lobata TaxID=97700 RepID=A0A7N2R2S9_QUELO